MTNVPRALKAKVDNIQEQMDNVNREMEIQRIQKKCQRYKKSLQIENTNAFNRLRKDSLRLRICQQKLKNEKSKKKKKIKPKQNIQELWDNFRKYNTK